MMLESRAKRLIFFIMLRLRPIESVLRYLWLAKLLSLLGKKLLSVSFVHLGLKIGHKHTILRRFNIVILTSIIVTLLPVAFFLFFLTSPLVIRTALVGFQIIGSFLKGVQTCPFILCRYGWWGLLGLDAEMVFEKHLVTEQHALVELSHVDFLLRGLH